MYKVQKFKVRLVKDGSAQVVARDRVPCTEAAAELFASVLRGLPHEEVWIAVCSAQHDVRGLIRAGQGGSHACALRPSDVLRPVLLSGQASFILAHNHPSGDPTPSHDDVEMTRALCRASEIVGVTFLDHIIWTQGGQWRSLRDVSGCFED